MPVSNPVLIPDGDALTRTPRAFYGGTYDVGLWQRSTTRMRNPPNTKRAALFTTAAAATATSSTLTDDITDPLQGTTNVRWSIASTALAGLKVTSALVPAIDVTASSVRIALKVANVANIGDYTFEVRLSSDNAAGANYHEATIHQFSGESMLVSGQWQVMSLDISEFVVVGTGATLTSINNARLVAAAVTAQTATIDVGYIDVAPRISPKAKCVLWFDDGNDSAFTSALPRMSPYGFPGVLAPNSGQMNTGSGTLSTAMLRVLHDIHGWQLSTHAWTNDQHNSAITGTALEEQFMRSRVWQAAQGFYGGDDFSYYGGAGVGVKHSTAADYALVRRYFRSARGFTSTLRTVETIPVADAWRLRAHGTGAYSPAEEAHWTTLVDKAIVQKGLLNIVWHANLGGPEGTAFANLMAYLDTKRAVLDVVTIDQALASANASAG